MVGPASRRSDNRLTGGTPVPPNRTTTEWWSSSPVATDGGSGGRRHVMIHHKLLTLLSLAVGCSPAVADSFTVTLKVVDADNKPVAKAGAALFWTAKDGTMTPAGEQSG